MKKFKDKVAVVTGGGSGIGAAISSLLAENGANVIVAHRNPDKLSSTLSAVHYIQADLRNSEDCENVIANTFAEYGQLDILVNNAGMMLEQTVEEMSLADWQTTMNVNLTAPFLLSKYAIPLLRRRSGNIVNIGSIEGFGANPKHPAYCASKAGLHGLTRAIAIDHGTEGIRCNAVAPGWIDTDLNIDFVNSLPDDPVGFKTKIGDIHPIGRTGQPVEVAQLVCWLASDEASFITGQVYIVDGGRMAKLSLPG